MTDNASENNKRIAKNTLFLYIRMIFVMAIQLFTSRVILNTLGVTDYGIYNVVGGVVTMLGFLNGTMSAATQRYMTFELGRKNSPRLQTIFSTAIQVHAIISLIIILLGETIGLWFLNNKMQIPINRENAAFWVYQCSIVTSIVMIMSVPYNAVIIAHEKMSAFAYISIIEVTLKLLIVYLLIWASFDKLILYAFLTLFVQLFIRLCYTYYCNKHFEESKYRHKTDKNLLKEMTQFAGWNVAPNIVAVLNNQGLNILLNLFFGPVVNAARGIAIQVQTAMNQLCTNFQMAINPQIIKSYASENYNITHQLMYRSARFSFYLLLIMVLPMMLETNYILTLWLKVVPENTVIFLRIMMGCILLWTFSNPMSTLAQASGKIKIINIAHSFIVILALPFSWIALKIGAPAYWAFIFVFLFEIISVIVRMNILSKLNLFSIKAYIKEVYVRAFFVITTSSILPTFLCHIISPGLIRMILTTLVSVLCITISCYFLGITKEERLFITNKIMNLLK